MINITIDKNDLLEYLEDSYKSDYKAFIKLSEREQNDLLDNLVYLCYKEIDEIYILHELLGSLTK